MNVVASSMRAIPSVVTTVGAARRDRDARRARGALYLASHCARNVASRGEHAFLARTPSYVAQIGRRPPVHDFAQMAGLLAMPARATAGGVLSG